MDEVQGNIRAEGKLERELVLHEYRHRYRKREVDLYKKAMAGILLFPFRKLVRARIERELRRNEQLLLASGLFDPEWYVRRYPEAKPNPARHYLTAGALDGADPSPKFSTYHYLAANDKIRKSGVNPLVAYASGTGSGRILPKGKKFKRNPGTISLDRPTSKRARKLYSEVQQEKAKLLALGFTTRSEEALRQMAEDPSERLRSVLAAWQLSLWYSNQGGHNNSQEALRWLDKVLAARIDREFERRAIVLQAEVKMRLGDTEGGRRAVDDELARRPHPDLYLLLTALENDPVDRVSHLNSALSMFSLEKLALSGTGDTPYDSLSLEGGPPSSAHEEPMVTVIVPSFNAASTITTTLRSLCTQTWRNLEIIVSDDCSQDRTADVVRRMAAQDPRIRVIANTANSGPYVARNAALQIARGEFVTVNDADDWSHPRKIELQVRDLLERGALANTSQQARISEDLVCFRRGNPGFFIQFNISSLMFRRVPVLDEIGYWDSVRFAADSEYMRRINRRFGEATVEHLETGPVSFQRQTTSSLTASEHFGYHGHKMGARKVYEDRHREFHQSGRNLYVPFPLHERPFPVPDPMKPQREANNQESARHFDVIIASDFRLEGGTTHSNAEEIKAQIRAGLRTGLVQLSIYELNPGRRMDSKIGRLIDGDQVDLLVYGERATCDLLIIRQPWAVQELQAHVPTVEAKHVRVIANQTPKRDYSSSGEVLYSLSRCQQNVETLFGSRAIWHPIGPKVRSALLTHHAEELSEIELAPDDWYNIIDVTDWRREGRPPRGPRTRICRHSRDSYVKWPNDARELLQIYPEQGPYEVHILGGSKTPETLLRSKVPGNWVVHDFGEISPRSFLERGDVYVYFTHPDCIEAFGRVILEAMAVGLPVILSPDYEVLFGNAAIYAEPSEVLAQVDKLMECDDYYEQQVQAGWDFVEAKFSYKAHLGRLSGLVSSVQPPVLTE